ncbi:hypothetical protein [Hymenobacter sp.]|jgi:hypothetical protein|uniref:hypothetical protein n=1 Tax=Hymenobacter sp. TaxID=1898978 RepID=UPI002EDA0D71
MIFSNVLVYKIHVLRPQKVGRKLATAFEILFKIFANFQPGNNFKANVFCPPKADFVVEKLMRLSF